MRQAGVKGGRYDLERTGGQPFRIQSDLRPETVLADNGGQPVVAVPLRLEIGALLDPVVVICAVELHENMAAPLLAGERDFGGEKIAVQGGEDGGHDGIGVDAG